MAILTFPTSQTLRKFQKSLFCTPYQGLNPELIVKAVKDLGAKGIVLAGSGAGSWTATGSIVNEQLYEQSMGTNCSQQKNSRWYSSSRLYPRVRHWIWLNPQNRVFCYNYVLYSGYGMDQIRSVFSGVYGG
ncbi:CBM_collapsed_G0039260.mRNA.1.CDS.1 [Saccharomyces cerevisiae]|nr:CBM_collapsed_G0039260.mRNA.1.CDS.1 [Saccharomyces cerevisiae]